MTSPHAGTPRSTHGLRRTLAVAASVALAAGGVALSAGPASAATFPVFNLDDTGLGSLRQALLDANLNPGADVISVSATGTLTLLSQLPHITGPVQIVGPAGGFTIDAIGSGIGNFGLYVDGTVTPGFDVSISDLTLVNARDDGIRADFANLTLTRVSILDSFEDGFVGTDGVFVLTDVVIEGSGDDGLDIELNGASYSATLTRVTSSDSDSTGIDGTVENGAVLTLDDVDVDSSGGAGIEFAAIDSTVSISNSRFVSNNIFDGSECGGGLSAIVEGSVVEVTGSTFRENGASDGGGMCFGVEDSQVTLTALTVVDNSGGEGGGLHLDYNEGESVFLIVDSAFTENEAFDGGAIFLHDLGEDGDFAGVSIQRSTFDDNFAVNMGAAIAVDDMRGTGDDDAAGLTILDSTFSNNEAEESGAGLSITSTLDASADDVATVVVQNSTFTGNEVTDGGGGGSIEALTEPGDGDKHSVELLLLNSTVSGNLSGAQFAEVAISGDVFLFILNSIVAGNAEDDLYSESTPDDDPSAAIFFSMVGNLSGSVMSSAFAGGTGNISSTAPGLGLLADNGGSTLTLLPAGSSGAVNAGDPLFAGLTADQRGEVRVSGGRIDMGAVELQAGLADTGSDAAPTLAGGVLLLILGAALLTTRRRVSPAG